MKIPTLVLALAGLGLVLVVFLWETGRTAPGPLSPTHQAVEALRGESGCAACHAVSGGVSTDACIACHEEIHAQVRAGGGFHGTMEVEEPNACPACHVEHHGSDVRLVSDAAFARAGVEEPAAYDHEGLALRLEGRHRALACPACHARADQPFLEPGQTRFLGLRQACTGCHEDPHQGRYGSACASCHGQQRPFGEAPLFKHPATFPLVAGHAGVDCASCHGSAPLAEASPLCFDCHDDDRPTGGRLDHRAPGFPTRCDRCHRPTRWAEARFVHSFPIDRGEHAGLGCADCHVPPRSFAAFSCVDCHEHERGEMAKEHRKVRGYSYESAACYRCHPAGREPDDDD